MLLLKKIIKKYNIIISSFCFRKIEYLPVTLAASVNICEATLLLKKRFFLISQGHWLLRNIGG